MFQGSGVTHGRMQRVTGPAFLAALALASCGRVAAPPEGDAAVRANPVPTAVTTAVPVTPAPAPAPPADEFTFTKCGLLIANPLVGPEAVLRITNRSSTPVSYYVRVGFFSKDGVTQYDTAHASAVGLPPGQSKEVEASSLKGDLRKHGRNGFTCKVFDVLRT